jgi:hypothetical protein
MRAIERRLSRLESVKGGESGVIVIPKPSSMPDDEAIRRHFGDQEPPKNALIVLIQQFCAEVCE